MRTIAGGWSDRRGPVPVLYAGMGLFVLGQLLMGLAPAMPVFVSGRLVGGLAEGLLDVGLTVLVARALPAELRPRIFATFAAAWVLPSLLGPSIAGVIAEQSSWRAVFLLGVALLVPVWACLRPALGAAARQRALDRAESPDAEPGSRAWQSAAWSLVAAIGLAALSAGGSLVTRGGSAAQAGAALLVVGALAVIPALRALLPAGTLTGARGIPALTALRGLLGAAFGTTSAFLPLMLTEVNGYGPAAAGVSLTITGIFWAGGSQVQGLRWVQRQVPVAARLQLGFGLLAVGLAGPALLAVGLVSPIAGLGLWAIAGVGIGICSPTISNHVLTLSDADDQGRNSAASFLAPSVTQALALAAAGTAVAWQAPHLDGALFAAIMGGSAALALLGLMLARRAG